MFPKLKKGLTVAHLNINRLLGKMDSVRELLSEFPLDIFTVSETWLSSHILDEELKIDGYSFVRKDRENTEKTQGGGLIVYVRDGINFSERDNISNGGIEDIWIEVKRDKCKNLLVGSFYRPPDQNLDYFNTSLSESLESLHGNICLVTLFSLAILMLTSRSMSKIQLLSVTFVKCLKIMTCIKLFANQLE